MLIEYVDEKGQAQSLKVRELFVTNANDRYRIEPGRGFGMGDRGPACLRIVLHHIGDPLNDSMKLVVDEAGQDYVTVRPLPKRTEKYVRV